MMSNKWFTRLATLAVAALLPVSVALADPPVAKKVVTSPDNKPPVPRGIPDLTPYWDFDPPNSPLFDIKRFTVSGDARVRPEYRNNQTFGITKSSGNFVQQWMRLGLNYAISPDVDVFFQPQWAKNWGAAAITGTGLAGSNPANIGANDPFQFGQGDTLFARQAFIMIRNAGAQGLSIKMGRQLVVMGNHRLFGHFDWANTGFSHDGITIEYAQPGYEIWAGWLKQADQDFSGFGAAAPSFGVQPPGVAGSGGFASRDQDMFFARLQFKPIAGLSIEPLWVYMINGLPSNSNTAIGAGVLQAHAANQNRHTLGGRVAYRKGMFDGTFEGYWQTGSMGYNSGAAGTQVQSSRDLRINASALAIEGGLTFANLPMQPRIGLEFNYASGDGDAKACSSTATKAACNGNANTFENLYPTNHIVMGYMDLFAWRNMTAYSASLQFKPAATNHVEIRGWIMRKSNAGDCWYRAAQNCYLDAVGGAGASTSSSLGRELDIIFTQFLKSDKVAWQTGVGYFWAGQAVTQMRNNAGVGSGAPGQTWAYTQIHVNF